MKVQVLPDHVNPGRARVRLFPNSTLEKCAIVWFRECNRRRRQYHLESVILPCLRKHGPIGLSKISPKLALQLEMIQVLDGGADLATLICCADRLQGHEADFYKCLKNMVSQLVAEDRYSRRRRTGKYTR